MSETTEALIKRVRDAERPDEAVSQLRPGQRARVMFAMYVRQLAVAMTADSALGIRVSEMLETQLEKSVDEMFMPEIMRISRNATRDHGEMEDQIRSLRAENTRLTERAARLREALKASAAHLRESEGMFSVYRFKDDANRCKRAGNAVDQALESDLTNDTPDTTKTAANNPGGAL